MRLTTETAAPHTAPTLGTHQADVAVACAFGLATILTRLPFRSHRAFNWDAVNFILALRDYDVRLHHPHPPGYPVFIVMGRVVQLVIPDGNAALVAVAMLLSAGAVASIFLLGRTLFTRTTGIVAALYLLCSVTFWTNGAVALAYPALALFPLLVALFAWRCRHSVCAIPPWAPIALSAAYAIGAGFRPDLLLFLLPLWLYAHWRLPLRRTVASACIAGVIVCAWFAPTIALSGGWSAYWKVFDAYTGNDVLKRYSVAENGPRALIVNVRDTATYTAYALYALALPVAGAAVWLLVRAIRERQLTEGAGRYTALFACWIAPTVLFYTWVHIGDPGYVFTFVPAFLLLAARFTIEIPRLFAHVRGHAMGRAVAALLVAAALVANGGVFLFRPITLTAHGIRQEDHTVDSKIAYVHDHGDPANTTLISYESYRHWLLYLPEYRVQFVDVTYGTDADRTFTAPSPTQRVILMDGTLLHTLSGAAATDVVAIGADRVGMVSMTPGTALHFASVSSPLGGRAP